MKKKPARLDIYPSDELVLALDRWRIEQPGRPSRPEMARRILEKDMIEKGMMERPAAATTGPDAAPGRG